MHETTGDGIEIVVSSTKSRAFRAVKQANRVFNRGKKMTLSGLRKFEDFFGRKFPIHPTSTYPGLIRTKPPPLGPHNKT